VIWFTLGNISVVGTYSTTSRNLTPRGLVFPSARLLARLLSALPVLSAYLCRVGSLYLRQGLAPPYWWPWPLTNLFHSN
jgi:hypothetical protein